LPMVHENPRTGGMLDRMPQTRPASLLLIRSSIVAYRTHAINKRLWMEAAQPQQATISALPRTIPLRKRMSQCAKKLGLNGSMVFWLGLPGRLGRGRLTSSQWVPSRTCCAVGIPRSSQSKNIFRRERGYDSQPRCFCCIEEVRTTTARMAIKPSDWCALFKENGTRVKHPHGRSMPMAPSIN
jgi:hypothetical protein